MTERATKSGLALEAQRKIREKYDSELAGQLLEWVAQLTGKSFSTDGDVKNFLGVFKDGTALCSLANALQPGSVKKINTSAMAFKQMENISFFLSFAEKHIAKSELFQTVDLFEGQDPNAVVVCLSSLARKSEELFGKPGLGPKFYIMQNAGADSSHLSTSFLHGVQSMTVLAYMKLNLNVSSAEAKGEKREWSEEKLRAGETIIGLQMGSNKGANASGINMGNTRHI
ncbi:hypothetical protein QQG55_25870 [Brugia pahangi]